MAQDDTLDRIESARDEAAQREAATPPANPPGETEAATEAVSDAETSADEPEVAIREEELRPLGQSSRTGFGAAAETKSKDDGWVLQTLGSLGVVIALILLAKYFVKKGAFGGRFASSAVRSNADAVVEVLSRTAIAPRNHVLLLRVGHRILVVNDSAGAMRTLATIEDPDEVAGLLQSVQTNKAASMSNTFAGVMSKVAGQWGGDDGGDKPVDRFEPTAMESDELADVANPIASLRGKLREMAGVGPGGGGGA